MWKHEKTSIVFSETDKLLTLNFTRKTLKMFAFWTENLQQDGRLPPVYFAPTNFVKDAF